MNDVSRIRPVSDLEVVRMVRPGTVADLADRIASVPVDGPSRSQPRFAALAWRRRAGLVIALGVAVSLLLTIALGGAGSRVGPVSVGPANAQALLFRTRGGFIDVTVRDPLADPARYRAEFAAHGLNITLRLVPVSPSLVGTLVFSDDDRITPIIRAGTCWTGGAGNVCPIGARIPLDDHGSTQLVFGRAARPGEQYESTTSATARGEALQGVHVDGSTVAAVRAVLRRRNITVAQYRWETGTTSRTLEPAQVPGIWRTVGAIPWARGQILLMVKPDR